jgi:hypothetical protein
MWNLERRWRIKEIWPLIKYGDYTGVEQDWTEMFAIIPRRTVSNRLVWLKKIYTRRVWMYTGFVDEPFTEYGDMFDVLTHP